MLVVDRLTVEFAGRSRFFRGPTSAVRAVDDVSFTVAPGETFGVVGESGSGKSTLANAVIGLLPPRDGTIHFEGREMKGKDKAAARRRLSMVFQDPFASLNARMRVLDIVAEPIIFHGLVARRRDAYERARELLTDVGLDSDAAWRFPHAFSGGQRQRIAIARAIASNPLLLVCDEPTSALDVSVQAQILNLLKDLKDERGLTLLLISHDLPVIRQMCDRIAVLRDGRICEVARSDDLFERPQHDYTRALLELIPRLDRLAP